MVGVEPLLGICVIHGPSDRYVEPVTRLGTNIVHMGLTRIVQRGL
jgi:hypothetical protein